MTTALGKRVVNAIQEPPAPVRIGDGKILSSKHLRTVIRIRTGDLDSKRQSKPA